MKLRKQTHREERFVRVLGPPWLARFSLRPGGVARAIFVLGVAFGRNAPRFRSRIRTRASR